MKFSNTLLLVGLALKFVASKKERYSYDTEDFKYNFHCLEDNHGMCKYMKKELYQAVDSISYIVDLDPTVKFEAIVDDVSKYRVDTDKETIAVVLDNDFVPLWNNTNVQSPYPNSKAVSKKIKNKDNDYLVILNNFKSDNEYLKSLQADTDEFIIVEMFEGLKSLNKLYFPYNTTLTYPAIEHKRNYTLTKRRNVTAIYETGVETENMFEEVAQTNNLHKIIFWEDHLISKGNITSNSGYRRVVAVGDLHGDYEKLDKILHHAKLVDRKGNWIAKDTILIQMGDIVDRGTESKKIFEAFIKLREQAKKYGGIVYNLLGNHEVLNLQSNYYYVPRSDYDTYGGFEKREKEFSMEGKIGRFMRSELNVTMVIDDSLYSHAGILPEFLENGVDYINDRAHEVLTTAPSFDELYHIYVELGLEHQLHTEPIFNHDTGPIAYKVYAKNPESEVCENIEKALKLTNTKRMILGHTVQFYGHINTKCDNKLILIDIGMCRRIGNYVGYLEILNDKQEIWARYLD